MPTPKKRKPAKPAISIIVPALNEEENIEAAVSETLKAIDRLEIEGEIIVVDDGSTDRTGSIVREMMKKDNRIKMIRHETPQGIGASYWDGVDMSISDIISATPGDNENDVWEILRYYKLLEHVDIVIPFIFNREVRNPLRNMLSTVFRTIINTTFLVNFNYTNGAVLYRKSILKELDYRSNGFFFLTDILIRAVKKGYLFAEVPCRLGARDTGVSKAVSFPSLLDVIYGYLRLLKDLYSIKNRRAGKTILDNTLTAERHNN